MPQVYLFAVLAGKECRYLHATRDTKEEACQLCYDLNEQLWGSRFHVVEDE
jgi:hypothetical protein